MMVRKVQYLIALAREGHFARAAAACHVSQPTLSAGIKQLEAELGVSIVKRGQRFCGLTPEGERVLAWAQRMASECERLHQELQELGADALGTLHVGVIPSALPLVPALTAPFQRRHPKASLRISGLNAFEIHRGLEEFTLDVALTYLDEKSHRHVRTQALYTEDYLLLVRRGHPLASRETISWAELSTLPLCLLSQDMLCPHIPLADFLRQPSSSASSGAASASAAAAGFAGIAPPATSEAMVIETNSITALHAHLRAGPWCSVLPPSLVRDSALGDALVPVRLPEDAGRASVGVAMPDRTPSPLAQAFFELATSARVLATLRDASAVSAPASAPASTPAPAAAPAAAATTATAVASRASIAIASAR